MEASWSYAFFARIVVCNNCVREPTDSVSGANWVLGSNGTLCRARPKCSVDAASFAGEVQVGNRAAIPGDSLEYRSPIHVTGALECDRYFHSGALCFWNSLLLGRTSDTSFHRAFLTSCA